MNKREIRSDLEIDYNNVQPEPETQELISAIVNQEMLNTTVYYDESTATGVTFAQLMKAKRLNKTSNLTRVDYTRRLQPFKPAQSNFSNLTLLNTLKSTNTKVLPDAKLIKNHALAEIEAGDADLFPFTWFFHERDGNDLAFPILYGEIQRWEPSYDPRYFIRDVDIDLYRNGLALLNTSLDEFRKDAVKRSLRKMEDINNKYYFGNGCISGQLSRHRACLAIKSELTTIANQRKGVVRHTVPYTEYRELMNKRFPLNKVPDSLDRKPTDILKDNSEFNGDVIQYIKVNLQSDAGPMWTKGSEVVKRQDVIGQDLDLADYIYEYLLKMAPDYAIHLDSEVFITRTAAQQSGFWDVFDFLRLMKMKPKAEVYERADFSKKTRNVYAQNSGGSVMAQMIIKPTHTGIKNFMDDPEVWSAIGFNPYNGGMTRLMNRILTEDKFICVYADNIYYVTKDQDGNRVFVSADGEKAESSIRIEEVQMEYMRSLECFNSYNGTWEKYAMQVAPELTVGGVALIGAQQIPTPFMNSGAMGTAYHNTTKSVRWADQMRKLQEDYSHVARNDAGEWIITGGKYIGEMVGAKFKVELVQRTDAYPDSMAPVPLDFLGWDVVSTKALGLTRSPGYIGVLNSERLYKALCFIKADLHKMPYVMANTIRLVRLRALYVIGGWYDPGLSQIIAVSCGRIKIESVNFDEIDWDAEMESLRETLEVPQLGDIRTVVATLTRSTIPTLYEVVLFHLGVDAAAEFVNKIVEERKDPWNFVPLNVLNEFGMATGQTIEPPENVASILFTKGSGYKEQVLPWDEYINFKLPDAAQVPSKVADLPLMLEDQPVLQVDTKNMPRLAVKAQPKKEAVVEAKLDPHSIGRVKLDEKMRMLMQDDVLEKVGDLKEVSEQVRVIWEGLKAPSLFNIVQAKSTDTRDRSDRQVQFISANFGLPIEILGKLMKEITFVDGTKDQQLKSLKEFKPFFEKLKSNAKLKTFLAMYKKIKVAEKEEASETKKALNALNSGGKKTKPLGSAHVKLKETREGGE